MVIIEGGAALGWVVGSMADLLSRLNLRKKRHYERMQYWEDVFYRGAFPPILRRKIRYNTALLQCVCVCTASVDPV